MRKKVSSAVASIGYMLYIIHKLLWQFRLQGEDKGKREKEKTKKGEADVQGQRRRVALSIAQWVSAWAVRRA